MGGVKRKKPDMARIGPSSDTRPEKVVRRMIHHLPGKKFNDRFLPGSPDITVDWLGLAIFIDGRHWHDPKTAAKNQHSHHREDWVAKARKNRKRDDFVSRLLRSWGWSVIRIWDDCTTTKKARRDLRMRFVLQVARARFYRSYSRITKTRIYESK